MGVKVHAPTREAPRRALMLKGVERALFHSVKANLDRGSKINARQRLQMLSLFGAYWRVPGACKHEQWLFYV